MIDQLFVPLKTYKATDKLAILKALETANDNSKVMEIMQAHSLHPEEVSFWKARYSAFGLKGLRATRAKR